MVTTLSYVLLHGIYVIAHQCLGAFMLCTMVTKLLPTTHNNCNVFCATLDTLM
jgi:hypothetical protein